MRKTLVDHEMRLVCPVRQPTESRPVRLQKKASGSAGCRLAYTASRRPVQVEARSGLAGLLSCSGYGGRFQEDK